MDFRQLEYIVSIAENKSISKAAESLFISQSGLNQQLIKLEKELGLQLFDRNKHFLRPTKAGEIYVKNAIEILKIKRNTYTELGDLKKEATGEISLGLTHEHGIDLFTSIFCSLPYLLRLTSVIRAFLSLSPKPLLPGRTNCCSPASWTWDL